MRALIFNSGLGSRLGHLTAGNPKALVRIYNGETMLGRQLRLLFACGIREFVITTGPYPEQITAEAAPYLSRGCTFVFVPNPVYDRTNYIYSMHLAESFLRGKTTLLLHGDLVFDYEYLRSIIETDIESLGSVNPSLPLSEKDFKARVIDGKITEVGLNIFDENCVAFQALYKLTPGAMDVWLAEIERFVAAGDIKVYAENAANHVFGLMNIMAYSYENHYVEEIDTPEDLERVSMDIRLFDEAQQPPFGQQIDW